MKRVIVESPYAGNIKRNLEYARACVKDSLLINSKNLKII